MTASPRVSRYLTGRVQQCYKDWPDIVENLLLGAGPGVETVTLHACIVARYAVEKERNQGQGIVLRQLSENPGKLVCIEWPGIGWQAHTDEQHLRLCILAAFDNNAQIAAYLVKRQAA